MNFSEALSDWLAVSSLGRKPRTVAFYADVANIMAWHWPAPEVAAEQITRRQVIEFANLPKVNQLCASRWNVLVAALRTITTHGLLLRRRAVALRQFEPPPPERFAAFLSILDGMKRTKAGTVARFLAFSGLRIGEAMALTWGDVSGDTITVPAHIAKNGKARAVPVLPEMRSLLATLKRGEPGALVLPRGATRKAIEVASRRGFGVQWSYHCLRHYFATRCIQSGVDLPTVARWLGHSDGGALLARRYFHLSDEHSRAMASRVAVAIAAGPCVAAIADGNGRVTVAALPW